MSRRRQNTGTGQHALAVNGIVVNKINSSPYQDWKNRVPEKPKVRGGEEKVRLIAHANYALKDSSAIADDHICIEVCDRDECLPKQRIVIHAHEGKRFDSRPQGGVDKEVGACDIRGSKYIREEVRDA